MNVSNNNDVDPAIIDDIDQNARYFVVNVVFPDFLILYSLNTRQLFNRSIINPTTQYGIHIAGCVMSVASADIYNLTTYDNFHRQDTDLVAF